MPFTWHLAHAADIAAYLARHEDGLRAMDAVLPAATLAQEARAAPPQAAAPEERALVEVRLQA